MFQLYIINVLTTQYTLQFTCFYYTVYVFLLYNLHVLTIQFACFNLTIQFAFFNYILLGGITGRKSLYG